MLSLQQMIEEADVATFRPLSVSSTLLYSTYNLVKNQNTFSKMYNSSISTLEL